MAVLIFLLLTVLFIPLFGIGQHTFDTTGSSANEYMQLNTHEQLATAFESSERDNWQKPDEVIRFLGDIKNKTIVDLGCGSGYFSFRLVEAGANVIAADIDPEFLKMISDKQKKLKINQDRLKTMQISERELNIERDATDVVFLVNVYHHISNRISYFNSVNSKLKEHGKIVIIDFYKKELPVGPPKNHKISKDDVLKELKEAGFVDIDVNTDLLDFQYIITVNKF